MIIPQYLVTFLFIISGAIPATHPTPRLILRFIMIILYCLTYPDHVPDYSWLAGMISLNTSHIIISLFIDIIMILVTIVKSESKVCSIVDYSLTSIILLSFICCMGYSLASAPILSV